MRFSTRQDPAHDQTLIWRLSRAINASLKVDRRQRTEDAGVKIEAIFASDPPFQTEAWQHMKGWYKAASDRAPPPARVTLEQIMAEWVALYRQVPPPGEDIPISVDPFQVEDSVPTEDNI